MLLFSDTGRGGEHNVFHADSNYFDYGDYDEEWNHQNFWAQDIDQGASLEDAGGRHLEEIKVLVGGRSNLLEWIRGRRRAFVRYSQV